MKADKTIHGQYAGKPGPLFWLTLKTALLTAITLGIYRFWARTRIRKYIWSSAEGDGDGFEYTGTGIEKMLGFLVAIVVIAILLGAIQAILLAAGLGLAPEWTQGGFEWQLALNLASAAALPLIYFALYRARRYRLSRTRWRGVRFGAEKAAWGYAVRAVGYLILTVATAGILLPLSTFRLEKYMTDRTWYGDVKFEQNGKWTSLYPAMKHLLIGLAIMVGGGLLFAVSLSSISGFGAPDGGSPGAILLAVLVIVVGFVWLWIGSVHYRVRSFAYLASNRNLGGQIRFDAEPKTSQVVKSLIWGGIKASFVGGIVFAVLAVPVVLLYGEVWSPEAGIVISAVFGLLTLSLISGGIAIGEGLNMIWIVQPIIAHFVQSVSVLNSGALASIRQRAADGGADAEGIADALDIGAAI